MKSPSTLVMILLSLVLSNDLIAQKSSSNICIGRSEVLVSSVLQEERTINIYQPNHFDPKQPCDVFYLLDGALDEDFVHISGLFAFYDMMYIMPNYINTDRKRDFTFPTTIAKDKEQFPTTGGSAAFIRFLKEELKPRIEKEYITSANDYLIGQSLGGLIATEILIIHPQMFSHYYIVSPSLWWDNESLLKHVQSSNDYHNYKQVYIAVGEHEEKRMRKDAKRLFQLMKKHRSDKSKLKYEVIPDEDHATVLHHAITEGLRITFPPRYK
jgi:predicted alpha/beta superfamily hydrolase